MASRRKKKGGHTPKSVRQMKSSIAVLDNEMVEIRAMKMEMLQEELTADGRWRDVWDAQRRELPGLSAEQTDVAAWALVAPEARTHREHFRLMSLARTAMLFGAAFATLAAEREAARDG